MGDIAEIVRGTKGHVNHATLDQLFALLCVNRELPSPRTTDSAGRDGHLSAIAHDVIEQTSRIKEFAQQTAVCTRMIGHPD